MEGFQHLSACFSSRLILFQLGSNLAQRPPDGGIEELLHKYDLDVFVDVVKAIKEANREGRDGK